MGRDLADVRMADTACECTEGHWPVHLNMGKMVIFMSCVFCYNKEKEWQNFENY